MSSANEQLFDATFLRSLEGLQMAATRVPAHGRHAEQRSRQRGAGAEFTDVRPYVPGDDFRNVDWHVFQRLDRMFLRLFLEEQDLPVYCLLDQSASMAPKSVAARQTVAALAYVTLHHMDRFWVLPFADQPLRPLPALAGKNAFHRLLSYLQSLRPQGTTGLIEAIERFAHRRYRRGLCLLISDFYDERGLDAVLPALAQLPHRMLLVRPIRSTEAEPQGQGEHLVIDCETGEQLAVSIDSELRARYRDAYAKFRTQIATFAKRRSAGLLEIDVDLPVVPQLATLFPGGILRV